MLSLHISIDVIDDHHQVGPQELGGAEMHTTVSGVADNVSAVEGGFWLC